MKNTVRKAKRSITCKFCGKRSLYWIQTNDGWKLEDKHGKIHDDEDCPPRRKM